VVEKNKSKIVELNELSLLFNISSKLGETLDLKEALSPVLDMMAEPMGILRGTLTILNRNSGEIFIEEAYGLSSKEVAKGRYRLGEGITGKVVNTGEPVIIPRISDEPLFLDKTGSRKNLNKKDIAFICVPIISGSEVIGTLSLDKLFKDKNSLDDDVRLLTIIASIISQAVRLRQLAQEETDIIKEENRRLHDELRIKYAPKNIIGNSKTMRSVYDLIEKVSGTNTTVLILGESGVGKEKVANAIHYNSGRKENTFVKINCAALPESLIESELFGHEKGAFTGALSARKGRFEMAQNGTIFLDEIGELSLSVQTKLLRIIQEKELERVGGNETIKINVRIITATNRDLEKLTTEGKFREDLYYRLNVFPIIVPPLREKKTDIMLLADYFLEKYTREHGKSVSRISASAVEILMSHRWPGNVRELENCIERAVILSTDGVIQPHHLPPSIQTDNPAQYANKGTLEDILAGIEKELIIEELKKTRGNMALAARSLGITERIIGLRVSNFGINIENFK
jgi:Nif-specific regulatory protein